MPQTHAYADYDRASLKAVLQDVRRNFPAVDVSRVDLTKSSTGQYAFRFEEFNWYGRAESFTEARAAGWSAWMRKQGVPEYV